MKLYSSPAGRPFHHLPPSSVLIKAKDFRYALGALIGPEESMLNFLRALEEATGNPNCFLTSSGRSALVVILLSLKRLSNRREVIVPAYTCSTVAQSVIRAGLQPIFCDVDPDTLDMDRHQLRNLINDQTLSVLPTHLYGLAQDITDLMEISEERNVFIVEDAAQSFGATINGKMVGSTGDFGFFSLGRGKSLPTGHGGIILTKERFLPEVSETFRELIPLGTKRDLVSILQYLALGIATTPMGWWFIHRSKLNPAQNGMDFEELPPIKLNNLSATQAGIATSILQRIDQVDLIRQTNALRLIELIRPHKYISLPALPATSEPVFLRLPIITNTKSQSERLFATLSKAGIGVSRSYYRTLPEMFLDPSGSMQEEFPGANHLAECLLTLPTHAYLKDEYLKRIKSVFEFID